MTRQMKQHCWRFAYTDRPDTCYKDEDDFSHFQAINVYHISQNIKLNSKFIWLISSQHFILWNKVKNSLHKGFKTLIGYKNINKERSLIFISLFSIIIFKNFLGLFPYVFTRTSHLTMTLLLALPLWLRFIIFGWINNTQHIFAHLVPQGTPPFRINVNCDIKNCINIYDIISRPRWSLRKGTLRD